MHVMALKPVGARIDDLDIRSLAADPELVRALRLILAEHGVLHLPGQWIDDSDFHDFLASLGELVFTVGETPVAGFRDLNVVSNVGRAVPSRSQFHVDTSYVSAPPAYTALRAVAVPTCGGATLFTNQYRAAETLPATLRELLDGRMVSHVVTGVDPGDDQEHSARHPLFRPHPITGRTALYLSTPERCAHISDLDDALAAEMVDLLIAHSTREDNIWRHRWAPGDVVIWDNGAVMHRADHTDVVGDRVLHRGMVAGR